MQTLWWKGRLEAVEPVFFDERASDEYLGWLAARELAARPLPDLPAEASGWRRIRGRRPR